MTGWKLKKGLKKSGKLSRFSSKEELLSLWKQNVTIIFITHLLIYELCNFASKIMSFSKLFYFYWNIEKFRNLGHSVALELTETCQNVTQNYIFMWNYHKNAFSKDLFKKSFIRWNFPFFWIGCLNRSYFTKTWYIKYVILYNFVSSYTRFRSRNVI